MTFSKDSDVQGNCLFLVQNFRLVQTLVRYLQCRVLNFCVHSIEYTFLEVVKRVIKNARRRRELQSVSREELELDAGFFGDEVLWQIVKI